VLIGPAGIGLLGIYQSITGLTATVAGLGIQTSGVRDIARFHGQGDDVGIAKTIATLRRVCWFTGIAAVLMLAALGPWISEISFGSRDYSWAIAALGLTILFGNISAGQGAVIQGTRRIGDIARISVWGSVFGTVAAIGLYARFGIAGIVPALLLMSMISLAVSTYYARQINIVIVATTWRESLRQAQSLIKFGLAMVFSSAVTMLVTYLIRILIIEGFSLTGAGVYFAAFSLSGMFVQFVLSAMGADFYPRLTSESGDPVRMRQLINEQTEIGLLLAFPGLLSTLVLAPYAIAFFYTAEFAPAADLLQWFLLGCIAKVLSWPLGFSILAKGQGGLFMATEIFFNTLYLGMVWLGLEIFGLIGVGVAFAVMNMIYSGTMLVITRYTIKFSFSRGVWQLLLWMAPLAIAAVLITRSTPIAYILPAGTFVTLVGGVLCIRQLVPRLGSDHSISRALKRLPGGTLLLKGI
jgi:antigen flippase